MLGRVSSPSNVGKQKTERTASQYKPAMIVKPARAAVPPAKPSSTRPSPMPMTPQLGPGISMPASTNVSASSSDDGIEIAEELAVDIGQLTNEVELADLGLDPLMLLVLSHKLRNGQLECEMRSFWRETLLGTRRSCFIEQDGAAIA